jgi:WD40 repeat protein
VGGKQAMARFSVGLISAPCDDPTARTICGYLGGQGIDVVVPPPQRSGQHSEVVLLSQGGMENLQFLHAVGTSGGHRRVPVVIDVIDGARLPEDLRQLNWIPWDDDNPERACAQILSASQTDLSVYRHARSTEAKALAWHGSQRGRDELITDLKQVKRLIAERAREGEQAGRHAEQRRLVEEFLQASVRRGKALRRWRRLRIAVAVAAVPFVALAGLGLFHWREQAVVEAQLQIATSDGMSDLRPEVQSVKMAALVLRQEASPKGPNPAVVSQLAAAVAEPWPESIFGTESSKALNSVALLDDPSLAVGADGGGNVSSWNIRTGERLWVRPVGRRVLQIVAASRDGAVVAAADDQAVHVLGQGKAEVRAVAVPGAPQVMGVSNDGRWLVYAVGGKIHRVDVSSASAPSVTVGSFDDVLAIRVSRTGAILAMVRSSNRVTVLDTATGRARWTAVVAHDPLMSGALAADGSVAVTGPGHQVYWSDGRAALQPTGQYVPDLLTAMAATSNGLLVWSSAAQGTQVYDVWNHLQLPPICRELSIAYDLVLSPAEDRVDCAGAGVHDVWRLGIDRPTATAPPGLAGTQSLQVTRSGGPVSGVTGTSQGLLQVTLTGVAAGQGGLVTLDPSGATLRGTGVSSSPVAFGSQGSTGKPSAVALTPDGATLAVGSDSGDVTEYDAVNGRALVRSSRWQAPDHSIVRRIGYKSDGMTVTTDTFVWRISSCTGCSAHPDRLVTRVMQRQMPCYQADLQRVVPADLLGRLGTRLCRPGK